MGKMSGLMENWPFEGPGPSMVSSRFSLGTFQELFARVRRYLGVTTPSEIASREGLGVMSADVEVESGIAGKNSADWRAGGINDMTWKPVPWVRVVVVVMAVGCVEFCFRGGREGDYQYSSSELAPFLALSWIVIYPPLMALSSTSWID